MVVMFIDPGDLYSSYVIFDGDEGVVTGKGRDVPNHELESEIPYIVSVLEVDMVVLEMYASYGMPVGKDSFETVYWIGRFAHKAEINHVDTRRITRMNIKMWHCQSPRAKDSNIRQALVDKYGNPSTKKNPNDAYNENADGVKMSKDLWAALAGATYVAEAEKYGMKVKYFDYQSVTKTKERK